MCCTHTTASCWPLTSYLHPDTGYDSMNREEVMLNETSPTQEDQECVTPPTRGPGTGKCGDREGAVAAGSGRRRDGSDCAPCPVSFRGGKVWLWKRGWGGGTVRAAHEPKLCMFKLLTWRVLCLFHHHHRAPGGREEEAAALPMTWAPVSMPGGGRCPEGKGREKVRKSGLPVRSYIKGNLDV